MSTADLNRSPGRSSPGVSLRTIAAVVIALLVLLFIVLNRDPTRISFVAKAPLWVALAVAAAGGFVAGFLLSRRRYKWRALTLECGQYFTVRVSRSAGRRPAGRGTVRGPWWSPILTALPTGVARRRFRSAGYAPLAAQAVADRYRYRSPRPDDVPSSLARLGALRGKVGRGVAVCGLPPARSGSCRWRVGVRQKGQPAGPGSARSRS